MRIPHEELSSISKRWDEIVRSWFLVPDGLSPSSTFSGVQLLARVLAPEAEMVVYADEKIRPNVIVPCSVNREGGRLSPQLLSLVSNLYPGRGGFIFDRDNRDAAVVALTELLMDSASFDVAKITVVADSEHERVLSEAILAAARSARVVFEQEIPYIEFPSTWDDYQKRLSKKFRYNIRASTKLLNERGKVGIDVYERSDDVEELLSCIRKIEMASWKEEAGTSLTKNPSQWDFHEQLVHACAADGSLCCYVLRVGGEPIAHILGLVGGSVFFDLKESYDETYREFSPGTVLKAWVFENLVGERITHWDFVGPAEFHKLRWTKSTYRIRQYQVFSRSLRGRAAALRASVSRSSKAQNGEQ